MQLAHGAHLVEQDSQASALTYSIIFYLRSNISLLARLSLPTVDFLIHIFLHYLSPGRSFWFSGLQIPRIIDKGILRNQKNKSTD